MQYAMKCALMMTLLAATPAYAQQNATDHDAHHNTAAPAATALSDGEVRKVDRETRKITLRHGPIANLGMPAMSMVFQVRDPALLDRVKAGDKIRFTAEKIDGAYTVTSIENTK